MPASCVRRRPRHCRLLHQREADCAAKVVPLVYPNEVVGWRCATQSQVRRRRVLRDRCARHGDGRAALL
jgi:hypothetical protein